MRQRGYVLIPVILILLIVGAVGYIVFQNVQLKNDLEKFKQNTSTVSTPGTSTVSAKPTTTNIPTPNSNPKDNRKVLKTNKFSMQYPPNWRNEGSVFMVGDNKVAELLPGILTLKDNKTCDDFISVMEKGGKIEGVETSFSNLEREGPTDVVDKGTKDINGAKWSYIVSKVIYEGGYPNWTGTWYPHSFCLTNNGKMFLINFYSYNFPTDEINLYFEILSTFKML